MQQLQRNFMIGSLKDISTQVVEAIPENNRLERIWKLAQIDFKRRYYNDRLGLLWALINPLFHIFVYYIVFTKIFKNPEEMYVMFLFSGILLWRVFAEISNGGMSILKSKMYLIENIQFDKVDLFISHALSVIMAFSINILIYFTLALISGVDFSWRILWFFPLFFNMMLICVASALILCTLYLYIDDIKHLWDMILFLGFWTSGVIINADAIIDLVPVFGYVNPFIGLLDNIRASILYDANPDLFYMIYDFIYAVILLYIAVLVFRRNEHLILEKL